VDAHAYTNNRTVRPVVSREVPLRGFRSGYCGASARKDEEERVALCIDLLAASLLEGGPE
jgi:hypothetical protein